MSKKSRQHRAKSAPVSTPPAEKAQARDARLTEQLQDQELPDGQALEQPNAFAPVSEQGQQAAARRGPDEQAREEQAQSPEMNSPPEMHAQEVQAQDEQSPAPPAPELAKKHASKWASKQANEQGRMQAHESAPKHAIHVEPTAQRRSHFEPHADIRGVLIQLAGARLLLPNANIAEVLSYSPPDPVDTAPEWLLGRMRWRGWQLPLVAFAELAGLGKEPSGLGSKVVVLKALGGNPKAPYFAILTQGFPRLVTVSQEALPDADSTELPPGVLACVMMNEDTAFVPDLVAVEGMINDALAQAA